MLLNLYSNVLVHEHNRTKRNMVDIRFDTFVSALKRLHIFSSSSIDQFFAFLFKQVVITLVLFKLNLKLSFVSLFVG